MSLFLLLTNALGQIQKDLKLYAYFVLNCSANARIRAVLLPAFQNVLLPIIAAKKAKKNLVCPSYLNPYAPPEPKLEELATALLRKSVKQTTLLLEILSKLKAMRSSLSFRVQVP